MGVGVGVVELLWLQVAPEVVALARTLVQQQTLMLLRQAVKVVVQVHSQAHDQ